MKVVIIHNCYPTPRFPNIVGGAEISVRFLAEGLAGTKEHEVVVIRGAPPHVLRSNEVVNGINVVTLPIRRPYWPYDTTGRSTTEKFLWHAAEIIGAAPVGFEESLLKFTPDVALVQNISSLGCGVFPILKKRVQHTVVTLRDYYTLCYRNSLFKNNKNCGSICSICRLYQKRMKRAERYVDGVVGISREMLDIHLENDAFRQVRIKRVISNCVDAAPQVFARDWPEVRFGYLGRLAPEKGLQLLASAFAELPPTARLLIAGSCSQEDRATLTRIARRPVEFLGFVAPKELFKNIDVLVAPSLWSEPFGRISIEAQAHGVPCVVSNRGGLPATVNYGQSGWVFNPDYPQELFNLLKMLTVKKTEIGVKAAQTASVVATFSVSEYVRQYNLLMSSL